MENDVKNNLQPVVDINDLVTVSMNFQNEEPETFSFKLIDLDNFNYDSEVNEVSIYSPLGINVYHKSVGCTGQYSVDGSIVVFTITNCTKAMTMPNEKGMSLKRVR